MWHGFDADAQQQLAMIKQATARRFQTPTHEWPVIFIDEHDALLVVREWPNGSLTAFTCSDIPGLSRGQDGSVLR
jgi:hypothetical protein